MTSAADKRVLAELSDKQRGQWLSDEAVSLLLERICTRVESPVRLVTTDSSLVGSMGSGSNVEMRQFANEYLVTTVAGEWAQYQPLPFILLPIGAGQAANVERTAEIQRQRAAQEREAARTGVKVKPFEELAEVHDHWSLLVRDPVSNQWWHYDSLRSSNLFKDNAYARLANAVAAAYEEQLTGAKNVQVRRLEKMPYQDAAECGFFTLMMALNMAEMGRAVETYDKAAELGWAEPFKDRFSSYIGRFRRLMTVAPIGGGAPRPAPRLPAPYDMSPQLEVIAQARREIGAALIYAYDEEEHKALLGSANWPAFRERLLALLLSSVNEWPDILEQPGGPEKDTIALMVAGLVEDDLAKKKPTERLRVVRLVNGAFQRRGEELGKAWAAFIDMMGASQVEIAFLRWTEEQLAGLGELLR